ncbi:28S rRNA (cytosine-C(5))-methyltransferase-like [Rhopilema esculentum]|uniref:28S rRNA (cytosine-C(5))-methyltransferase-like n=1 Tax=Rhopilema esculentum TaxID=499914 RepID=UPI0031D96CDC|eukprot:gene2431-18085_t
MEELYREASSVIEQAKLKKGSVKGLCFNSSLANKKKLYALVCQTLKHQTVLSQLLKQIDEDDAFDKLDESLQLVLAYDILFGRGIRCGGRIGHFVRSNKRQLFHLLDEFQKTNKSTECVANDTVSLPRYVRINTIKTAIDQVIKKLESEGWKFVNKKLENLGEDEFFSDQHIPDLLVFSPGTDLHEHPLYINGHILLQDKASCLPAFLLKPEPSSTVIDACAAPGNKTTHLSAIMENQGKIYAFDLDVKRLRLLKSQLKKAGTKNVEAMHQDFLKADPKDKRFQNVKYILLDPSCSGSGMVSRMDHLLDNESDNTERLHSRLEALSKFQYAMLCHALSFPQVKKVSYSTCSIHVQENETVVERAYKRFSDKFSMIKLLPHWEHRGLESSELGPYCLRASPDVDKTNGFFVAVFKRMQGSESQELEKSCTASDGISKKHRSRKRRGSDLSEVVCERSRTLIKSSDTHPMPKKSKNELKRRKKRGIKLPVTLK